MQNRSFSYDKEMYRQSMSLQDSAQHPYVPKPSSPYLFDAYSSKSKIDYCNDTHLGSPKSDFPHYKGEVKRKPADRSIYCLVAALAFFVLLSLIMTALFLWRLNCCQPTSEPKTLKGKSGDPTPVTKTCYLNHRQINTGPLPSHIRDVIDSQDDLIQKAVKGIESRTAVATNIVYDGKVIWSKTYGALNESAVVPQTPLSSTVFPVASVSKVFTALALFKIHNMGLLSSLDEEVVALEPHFTIRNPFNKHNITLRELGAMRSGLPREAPCYPPRNQTNLCPHDYKTMLKRISNVSLLRPPGTEPQYSNFGYSLLGQVLAKTIGKKDYGEWIKKLIFDPLNMRDTSFELNQRVKKRLPVAYFHPVDWGWSRPTGGAFSTIHDLAKMEIALFKGKFLPTSVVNDFLSPVYVFPNGKDMSGIPWEMSFKDGLVLRSKGGYVFGYSSYIAIVPELKLAFNFLYTNSLAFPPQVFAARLLAAFKTEIENQAHKSIELPSNPEAFVGKYQAPPEIPLLSFFEVKLQDNALMLFVTPGETVFTLSYVRPLTFELRIPKNVPCFSVYALGVENDLIRFDELQSGVSTGFTIYGAHPGGNSHLKRIKNDDATSA